MPKIRAKIDEMKAHYARGGLGDSVVKKYLLDVLLAFLEPIRQRRLHYAKDPAEVMRFLFEGSRIAASTAGQTLAEVRRAIGIDYAAGGCP